MTVTAAPPTLPEVTAAIVRAYLTQAQAKGYAEGVIGLRGRVVAPVTLESVDAPVRVLSCPSALAVAAALRERARGEWLVVVTDRTDADLGRGLTAHLVHQRLVVPNLWDTVRDRFAAQHLEGLLVREGRALAEALLAESPPEGWPPAVGGTVTRDTAYEVLAGRVLGLPVDRLDPLGLMEWTLDPGGPPGLRRLADRVRSGLLGWLAARTGSAGTPTLAVVAAGRGSDAVPLAVAAGVLARAADREPAAAAYGRLSATVGADLPTGDAALTWADAARTILESHPGPLEELLDRAASLLAESGGAAASRSSDVLPAGFRTRLHGLAAALDARDVAAAEAAYAGTRRHLLADRMSARLDTALMGLRLLRWLAAAEPAEPASLAAAVARQVTDDGWVDRARADVWVGDEDPTVAAAYHRIYDEVTARRERHDETFGRLLADATGSGAPLADVVAVEDVVRRVVLPIATHLPVLLAVVDGMSIGVATEVAEGLAGDGLVELGQPARRAALAALPSVTSVSRTTLFTGTVGRGGQSEEKAGLAALAGTVGVTATVLHKADLDRSTAGELLPRAVLAGLAGTDRVVGVVLNTVDDALDRSDPGATTWDLDAIKHLRPLLRAARDAGRVVVLTSDHGHVIERRDGEQRFAPDATSSRWRPASSGPGDGEVLVAGPRVVTPDHRAVLPWRETLRYKPLQAGYHGGASPAEVVIPLTVHAPAGVAVPGWSPTPPQAPPWWLGVPPTEPVPDAGPTDGALFPLPAQVSGRADAVLSSAVYRMQRKRSHRVAITDATVATVLESLLAAASHRLPQAAVAAAAGMPDFRLPGVIAHLQRLLNVDGFEVIAYDVDGVTVVLDEPLLREQFRL